MRAIIDTNVLLSGLFWHGAPHRLLERVRGGELVLITSSVLLAELTEVLGRPKFSAILHRTNTSQERVLGELQKLAEIVTPAALPRPVCRDPDDDAVLAAGCAAQADIIVSGDDDLLALKTYQSIRIVTPAEALGLLTPG